MLLLLKGIYICKSFISIKFYQILRYIIYFFILLSNSFNGTNHWKYIGINLIKTYNCVKFWQKNCVEIIENNQGNRTTPPYVAIMDTELIDNTMKNQIMMNMHKITFDAKCLINCKLSNPLVQRDMKLLQINDHH